MKKKNIYSKFTYIIGIILISSLTFTSCNTNKTKDVPNNSDEIIFKSEDVTECENIVKKFIKCANEKDSEGMKQCMSSELPDIGVDPYVSYEVEGTSLVEYNGYYEDSYVDKGKYLERKYIAGDNLLAIKVDGKKTFSDTKETQGFGSIYVFVKDNDNKWGIRMFDNY